MFPVPSWGSAGTAMMEHPNHQSAIAVAALRQALCWCISKDSTNTLAKHIIICFSFFLLLLSFFPQQPSTPLVFPWSKLKQLAWRLATSCFRAAHTMIIFCGDMTAKKLVSVMLLTFITSDGYSSTDRKHWIAMTKTPICYRAISSHRSGPEQTTDSHQPAGMKGKGWLVASSWPGVDLHFLFFMTSYDRLSVAVMVNV